MDVHMFSGSGFAWRVQLALAVKGIEWKEIAVEPSQDVLKGTKFLTLNPRGKVPVITEGDYTLPESLAILAYIDKKHPTPPLFGNTPEETGLVWKACLDFDLYVVNDWVFRFIALSFTGQVESQADDVRAVAQASHTDLTKFEAAVAKNGWLVGSSLSAADISIYPILEGLLRAASKESVKAVDTSLLDFSTRYPALTGWADRIRALPNYKQTYPSFWRTMDEAA